MPPLVAIVGPTGVGKTEISIDLAGHFSGEIVSADSRLFYRGMDIGTAKPSLEERSGVPHHLIDVAEPDQPWSLALFQREARRAIAGIHDRGGLPFLVGGTGQYIRAVVRSWEVPPVPPQPALRLALESWAADIGGDGLYHRLAALDPSAAARIDPRNLRRTVRALEVILTTGRPFSEQRSQGEPVYRLLTIGLSRPRPELYARIDARIDRMVAAGFAGEVRRLLDRGYSPTLPTLSAIGYPQMIAYLQGRISLEEAVTEIKRLTRQFVRRQANWFKPNDPDIHWFQMNPETISSVSSLIQAWLERKG